MEAEERREKKEARRKTEEAVDLRCGRSERAIYDTRASPHSVGVRVAHSHRLLLGSRKVLDVPRLLRQVTPPLGRPGRSGPFRCIRVSGKVVRELRSGMVAERVASRNIRGVRRARSRRSPELSSLVGYAGWAFEVLRSFVGLGALQKGEDPHLPRSNVFRKNGNPTAT